ncbi:TadE/TadG family type IV pilus assembly protein [Hyphomonas sp.]|uniref:TadE/TadG family type IV pilus assembly protein n=1 Tax=Hyphomonas sp. TaxID=87 RepID=UPI0032ED3ADF|tara:strand:+ start:1332 stop:1943 length:612 start_codon:yes stop_codon:yes gene_type:complete
MSAKSFLSRMNRRLKWRGIQGLHYNEKGVSAVEFALIAPLMVLIYFGCIELSFLMRMDRRVTSTSSSLGDLTARLATVTDDDMAEMFAAAKVMMQPYDAEAGSMRISSIVDDGDGVTKVAWSDAYAMSPLSEGSVVTVPDGIIPSPGSAIVAEVQFNYQSPFGYVLKLERTVSDKFYLRPRRVSEISRTHKPDGDGTSFGPTS